MRYDPISLRLGTTALAAVAVLSATPAAAQALEPAAAAPVAAPVIVAPPAPVVAPATAESTVTPDAASPATTVATPAVSAPAFSGATRSTPIYHQPEPSEAPAAATARTTNSPATRRVTTTRTAETRPAAPVSTPPVPRAAAVIAPPAAPPAAPRAAIAPTAGPAPVVADATGRTTPNNDVGEDVLPIAGAGAAALLLIGGGFALFRRRRNENAALDDEYVLTEAEETIPASAPALAAAPAPFMARREQRRPNALPSGFDLSRFGRHTQAAYRGPTSDNPSHSLRNRLKRASFFDGRERMAMAAGAPAPSMPVAARTSGAVQDDGQIVVRPGTAKPRNFFRPAFSS